MFSFPGVSNLNPGFEPVGLATFTDYERSIHCLVDGFESKYGRDMPLVDLLQAASLIADAMDERGWAKDASRLRDGLRHGDGAQSAELVGQELLCQGGRLFREAGHAPRSLVASLARHWPTTSE